MTKNIIKNGINKIGKNNYFGKRNIMKTIKNMYSKCIRLGRKKMWIKAVPYGVNMVAGAGSKILTSIKNIVSGKNSKNV